MCMPKAILFFDFHENAQIVGNIIDIRPTLSLKIMRETSLPLFKDPSITVLYVMPLFVDAYIRGLVPYLYLFHLLKMWWIKWTSVQIL